MIFWFVVGFIFQYFLNFSSVVRFILDDYGTSLVCFFSNHDFIYQYIFIYVTCLNIELG